MFGKQDLKTNSKKQGYIAPSISAYSFMLYATSIWCDLKQGTVQLFLLL